MGNPVRRSNKGGKEEPTSQCLYWYFILLQVLFFFELSLGRTVTVKDDLAMAYKSLDIILSRNKVRQTLRMEERHEKKGVKRRRLSSQRWRKRFADEVCFSFLSFTYSSLTRLVFLQVRKKVQLVKKIRDRGA